MNTIPEGKMLHDGELVDAFECCDVDYACSFPECVEIQNAEAARWAATFAAAPPAVVIEVDAYELDDPKHADWLERVGA